MSVSADFLKTAQELIDVAVSRLSELRLLLIEEQKRRDAESAKGADVTRGEQ